MGQGVSVNTEDGVHRARLCTPSSGKHMKWNKKKQTKPHVAMVQTTLQVGWRRAEDGQVGDGLLERGQAVPTGSLF